MINHKNLIEVALPLEAISKASARGEVSFAKTSISSYNRKILLLKGIRLRMPTHKALHFTQVYLEKR